MLDIALQGLGQVFIPANFLVLSFGVSMGIVFGALPGLTATMAVALLAHDPFPSESSR